MLGRSGGLRDDGMAAEAATVDDGMAAEAATVDDVRRLFGRSR